LANHNSAVRLARCFCRGELIVPSNPEIVLHLFIQLAVIVALCRVVGLLIRPLGQTQVLGDMVAGVLLGPSLLGLIAPGIKQWLFPTTLTLVSGTATMTVQHPSTFVLYSLGQIGLVLYMFTVGLEFNTSLISKHLAQASRISISGIVAPLILGAGLGFSLSTNKGLFGPTVSDWQAALFVASAVSITAFPVLARIIRETGMIRTKLGTIVLGAAATDDAVAWCLLAVVLAAASNSPVVAALAIGGGVVYAVFQIVFGRRIWRLFDFDTKSHPSVPLGAFAILVMLVLIFATITDGVGIHSIFGAFIGGVVMPRGRFVQESLRSIEPLTTVLLVPIFFVYSGLNTQMALLTTRELVGTTIVVLVISFVAKAGACFVASRLSGSSWRESASIGVLMNARGAMELILINIGLDRGIITPALFTIFVLMTIITTVVATPLFKLIYRPERLVDGGSVLRESAPLTE
jgi:Kef-type K+ transport system membrane component KefB